jgi:hypothetical protein
MARRRRTRATRRKSRKPAGKKKKHAPAKGRAGPRATKKKRKRGVGLEAHNALALGVALQFGPPVTAEVRSWFTILPTRAVIQLGNPQKLALFRLLRCYLSWQSGTPEERIISSDRLDGPRLRYTASGRVELAGRLEDWFEGNERRFPRRIDRNEIQKPATTVGIVHGLMIAAFKEQ